MILLHSFGQAQNVMFQFSKGSILCFAARDKNIIITSEKRLIVQTGNLLQPPPHFVANHGLTHFFRNCKPHAKVGFRGFPIAENHRSAVGGLAPPICFGKIFSFF